MRNVHPITPSVDPHATISPEVRRLAELLAPVIACAAELVAQHAPPPVAAPTPPAPTGLQSAPKAAAHLGVSVPTLHRFVTEGMPHVYAGDRRKFDVALCREWLAARGKRPTKGKAPSDNVNVDDILGRAGLKVVR